MDVFEPRIPHGFEIRLGDILQSFGPPAGNVEGQKRNRLTLVPELLERVESLSDDPDMRPMRLQWGKLTRGYNGYEAVGGPLIWDRQITGIVDPWGRLVKEPLR